MTLGDYLDRHGLSLRAFAKACGASASSIHRVRNGEVIPNRRLLEAIYRETGGLVTPADLIGVRAVQGRRENDYKAGGMDV